jgi:tetratricopeptide (TPR) repeat protein
MAPEQHRGERADARADQFAFCVALYEALYHRRPFLRGLLAAKESGRIEPPPGGTSVPAWLFRRLQRGLAPRPDDRFPDMHALLHALRPKRRGRWGLAAAAGTAALVGGLAMARTDAPCEGAKDALSPAWNDAQRERLRERFAARDGLATWTHVEPVLDDYADAWVGSWTDNCEATLVHRVQSQARADARVGCLGRLRHELTATLDALVDPGADILRVSGLALANLDAPSRCDDATVGAGAEALAIDSMPREQIEVELARVKAALATEDHAEALRTATIAMDSTAALDGTPWRARAQLLHARALSRNGDDEGALVGCERAIVAAMHARDERVEAEARSHRLFMLKRLGRAEDALAARGEATAAVERTGDARLSTRLYLTLSDLASATGDVEAATDASTRAVDAARAEGQSGLLMADALVARAANLAIQGDTSPAIVDLDEALAIYDRRLGPDHPRAANARYVLGTTLFEAGRPADAKVHHEACLATRRRALPATHVEIADVLMALAGDAMALGDPQAGRALAEEALVIYRENYGELHFDTARALVNLGVIDTELGELESALVHLDQAVGSYTRLHGDDDDRLAEPLFARGVVHLRRGRLEAARIDLRAAAGRSARMLGERHPRVAEIRAALAEADAKNL